MGVEKKKAMLVESNSHGKHGPSCTGLQMLIVKFSGILQTVNIMLVIWNELRCGYLYHRIGHTPQIRPSIPCCTLVANKRGRSTLRLTALWARLCHIFISHITYHILHTLPKPWLHHNPMGCPEGFGCPLVTPCPTPFPRGSLDIPLSQQGTGNIGRCEGTDLAAHSALCQACS